MRPLAFAGLVCVALFAIPPAAAQTAAAASFTEMSVRPGDDVAVTSRSGARVLGRVNEVSGSILRLAGNTGTLEVAEADTLQIDRLGDPVWQGLTIGAVVGGGAGAAVVKGCEDYCPGAGKKAGVLLAVAGIGAAVGVLIDLTIQGRTRVFEAPKSTRRLLLTPSLASERRALQVTFIF
jgi:hypothetical protein